MVRLNRFVDTGYAGIILGSDGQTVENNVFVRTMGTLNDGAAVYTNCNASIIRDNIILDTIGDLEYSHPWWPMGHGIWPEFLSDFHDTVITDNTLYGNNGHGIFLPNNFDCTISGNVIVDSRRAALGLYVDTDPNQGHVITGNTLVSTEPTRRIDRPENLSHWWLPPYAEPDPVALEYDAAADYGSMSYTTFVAPTIVGRGHPEGARRDPLHHPRRVDRRRTLGVGGGQSHQPDQRHSPLQRHRGGRGRCRCRPEAGPCPTGRRSVPPSRCNRGAARAGHDRRRGVITALPRRLGDRLAGGHPGYKLSR